MKNYFDILGVAQSFSLDSKELRHKYLQQQMLFHPDKLDQQETEKYRDNYTNATLLNEAYKILSDNFLRAKHLLEINGIIFEEQNTNQIMSIDYLEEIINEREQLEEVTNIKTLEDLLQIHQLKLQRLLLELENNFISKQLQSALDLTIRLQYLTNLVNHIKIKIKAIKNATTDD